MTLRTHGGTGEFTEDSLSQLPPSLPEDYPLQLTNPEKRCGAYEALASRLEAVAKATGSFSASLFRLASGSHAREADCDRLIVRPSR